MSHQKVLELAKKFAEKNLQEQQQSLEDFGYDFTDKLRAILGEMASDLGTLKEKGYDKAYWKQLGNLYQRLIEMRKDFDYYRPYVSVEKISNFIFSKEMFFIIQNLHHTIQKHLKENEVDFKAGPGLSQSRADSLKKLVSLLKTTNEYIKAHPLEMTPRDMPTSAPPKMETPKSDYKPVSSENITRVDKTK